MAFERFNTESLVPAQSLQRFLTANSWAIVEDREGEWEIWRSPDDLGAPPVTLVLDHEYFDYEPRLFEANQIVREAYRLSAVDLAEKITSLSADLIFFRIDHFSRDDTISFKQAQQALEGISTMVRAAATTTVNPKHSHQGKRPAVVDSFLNQQLRLGHTKHGSFVVTAVARFDDEEDATSSPDFLPENLRVDTDTPSEAVGDTHDPVMFPFGRRVMTTLSRGLRAAREVARDEIALGIGIEDGLSVELVDALAKVSSGEGLRTIDVSFDWSSTVPMPRDAELPRKITFDRQVIDALPRISERLQIREQPKEIELLGQVTALSRSVADEEAATSGDVTIFGEVDGRSRRVTVHLEGVEHDWAIRAYRERFPVIVTGQLVKHRSWALEGDVSLDQDAAQLMAVRSSAQRASKPHDDDDGNSTEEDTSTSPATDTASSDTSEGEAE